MDVLPAVDLFHGKCVRLVQGRYDRVIEYERDPVEVVSGFLESGAVWVHVIDLEGARTGRIANLDALQRLAATGARVEFGGGVRDERAIESALGAGAERVIIGTRALSDWDWFRNVVHDARYMNRVSLGLDARLGKLAVHGWTEDTERTALDVAEAVSDWPLSTIVYTDIGRDGMLLGPNIEAIRRLADVSTVPVVASGGVTDIDDIQRLAQLNLAGTVIGRAIYEGAIELAEALRVAHAKDEGR